MLTFNIIRSIHKNNGWVNEQCIFLNDGNGNSSSDLGLDYIKQGIDFSEFMIDNK